MGVHPQPWTVLGNIAGVGFLLVGGIRLPVQLFMDIARAEGARAGVVSAKVAYLCCGRKVCLRAGSRAWIPLEAKRKRGNIWRRWDAGGGRPLLTWTKVSFQAGNSHLGFLLAMLPWPSWSQSIVMQCWVRRLPSSTQLRLLPSPALSTLGCWEPRRGRATNQ